ncbi:MAG: energy transducer TonB [Candidatus Dadabacteria bacterium]
MRLLLLIVFIPVFSYAQKSGNDTMVVYLAPNLEFTAKNNAAFYGLAMKEGDHWLVYAIYPDTTPVLRAYYKDKTLKVKDGPYTVYYAKNKKAKDGYYHNNKRYSVWRDWYENGQLRDSGRFNNDRMEGEWKSYYNNGALQVICNFGKPDDEDFSYDGGITVREVDYPTEINMNQSSRNGKYTSWYMNGNREAEGKFTNNQFDGEWKWYYDNGKPSTIEQYKKGILSDLSCFDSTGMYTGVVCSVVRPALLKHYGNYRQFIYDNLLWPEEAIKQKLKGNVHISFKVTKEGQLKDFSMVGGHQVFRKAVSELFEKMKEWEPAVSHNRPIETEEEMDIPFYRKF